MGAWPSSSALLGMPKICIYVSDLDVLTVLCAIYLVKEAHNRGHLSSSQGMDKGGAKILPGLPPRLPMRGSRSLTLSTLINTPVGIFTTLAFFF